MLHSYTMAMESVNDAIFCEKTDVVCFIALKRCCSRFQFCALKLNEKL